MPKLKTHKGAAKRFKKTATGKIKRGKAFKRHILTSKDTKRNHVLRFLEEGDKVKASLRFRGREMAHQNLGRKVLERLVTEVGDKGIVEFRPRMEGNTVHVILAPPRQAPGGKKPEKPQQQQQAAQGGQTQKSS